VANALAGVSLAAALLPPLATFGLGLVLGAEGIALGAGLLFPTNLVAIVSAAGLFFFLMGFHPDAWERGRERTFRRALGHAELAYRHHGRPSDADGDRR
jgi:uncharacterized membrane protein